MLFMFIKKCFNFDLKNFLVGFYFFLLVGGLGNESDIHGATLAKIICEKMYDLGFNETYKFPISRTNKFERQNPASTRVLPWTAAPYPDTKILNSPLLSSLLPRSLLLSASFGTPTPKKTIKEISASLKLQHFYLPYNCILILQSSQNEEM